MHTMDINQTIVSDLAGHRIREERERRRLSRDDLAARCARWGMPELKLGIIRWIENPERARRLSVDELFALALALEIPPAALLVPMGDDEYQVTPTQRGTPQQTLRWLSEGLANHLPYVAERRTKVELVAENLIDIVDEFRSKHQPNKEN